MLGGYRTLLALCVVGSHLASLPFIGQYAVHGFFVLSGFLMTLVMHGTYGYAPAGVGAFALNRALRLFPSYWVVLALTLASIAILGAPAVTAFKDVMFAPETPAQWLQIVTMAYVDWFPIHATPMRPVPPTWALTVELFFYTLIALGISRSRRVTVVWFVASVILTLIAAVVTRLDFNWRYFSLLSGSLPFSLGAMLYHFREPLTARLGRLLTLPWAMAAFIAFGSLAMGAGLMNKLGLRDLAAGLSYLNLPLHAFIVLTLFQYRPAPKAKKVDKFLGDLSYPIYLVHYLCGMWVATLLGLRVTDSPSLESIGLAAIALVPTFILSVGLAYWVDAPVETLRRRIAARRKPPKDLEPALSPP